MSSIKGSIKGLGASLFVLAILCAGCMEDTKSTACAAGKVCTQESKNPDSAKNPALYDLPQAQEVIDNLGNNIILATYQDLNTRMQQLLAACQTLQTQKTNAALTIAQNAWKAARVPWESTESFLVGPVDALGIDPKLDTWPLATVDLQNVLNSSGTAITPDLVRALDTNLQGFHTAEFLLFGDGVNSNNRDVGSISRAEFSYLIAVVKVMTEHTQELFDAWTKHFDPGENDSPAFIDVFTLKVPAQSRGFTNKPQVFQTIIQDGMVGIADEVGNGKLATPFGASSASADPALVESQFSWNSLTDFQNNVESIVHLYTGTYNGKVGAGIGDLLKVIDPTLDQQIRDQLTLAKQKIADIAGPENLPFTQAIKNDVARPRIQEAMDQMNVLKNLLETGLLKKVN